jgi:hypothetical protein
MMEKCYHVQGRPCHTFEARKTHFVWVKLHKPPPMSIEV